MVRRFLLRQDQRRQFALWPDHPAREGEVNGAARVFGPAGIRPHVSGDSGRSLGAAQDPLGRLANRLRPAVVKPLEGIAGAPGRLLHEERGGGLRLRGRLAVEAAEHARRRVELHGRLRDRLLDELPVDDLLAMPNQRALDGEPEAADQAARALA